jgi:hypothetical protein
MQLPPFLLGAGKVVTIEPFDHVPLKKNVVFPSPTVEELVHVPFLTQQSEVAVLDRFIHAQDITNGIVRHKPGNRLPIDDAAVRDRQGYALDVPS